MSDNHNDIPDAERKLFQEAMHNVTPIKQNKKLKTKANQPRANPRKIRENNRQINAPIAGHESFSLDAADEPIGAEQQLLFVRAGMQGKQLRQLQRGQLPIGASLDLHKMSLDEAMQALSDFLAIAEQAEIRNLLIIHGKGLSSKDKIPLLKRKVNTWLKAHPKVLAFCSATRADGGAGALYVLLRRN